MRRAPGKMTALMALRPGAAWVLRGDDLEWLDAIQTQPTEAEIAAKIAEMEARATVPAFVSPLQMRRALRQQGLFADVQTFVAAAQEDVQEAWEYATQIDRDNALIAAAGAALGKTDVQIDDLFRLAATL